MFSRKEQRAALKKLGMQLQLHYLAYCLHGKADDLHQWRIGIKKARAFRALNRESPDGKKAREASQYLRQLYRETGRVRQEALNRASIQRLQADAISQPNSTNPPEPRVDPALLLYSDAANAWVRRHIRVLRAGAPSMSDRELRHHFSSHIRQLNKQFRRMGSVEELHKCRMQIKNLVYQYQALPSHIQSKIGLNVIYLQEVEDAIGQWHDAAIALEWGIAQELIDPVILTRMERECAALLEASLKKTRNFKKLAEVSN